MSTAVENRYRLVAYRPDALQSVLITTATVGLDFVTVVNQPNPFLMFLKGFNVRPVIESTQALDVSLVIAGSDRQTTNFLSLCHPRFKFLVGHELFQVSAVIVPAPIIAVLLNYIVADVVVVLSRAAGGNLDGLVRE